MSDALRPYHAALEAVISAGCDEFRALGIGLALPELRLRLVGPGEEVVRTDHRRLIDVAISSLEQLRPPPVGAGLIYGVSHELGHLAVAHAVAPYRLPPVVWDEALAHVLALDVVMPAVWSAFGIELWPTPYSDYPEREAALATSGDGAWMTHTYGDLLARQTVELREWIDHAGGVAVLLSAVESVASTTPRVEDWRWKLRGRLLR